VEGLLPIVEAFGPLALILARVGAVFLFIPVMSGTAVPVWVRATLAMSFGFAVFAFGPEGARELPDSDLFGYSALVASEALIGAAIGLIGGMPLLMLQLAGYLMGYQMGLGIAQTFNPALGAQGDVVGQLLFFLGLMLFVSVGGFEGVFLSLLESYAHAPAGSMTMGMAPLDLLVSTVSAGFELALSVAAPVLGVITLVLVAMGFIMKTMPQMNVLSIGFAIKILIGLLTLMFAIFIVADEAAWAIEESLDATRAWATSLEDGTP